jgi:FkbM family methyltransferase
MINWPQNRAGKKNAFVTVSTDYGSMIVNRFDYNVAPNGGVYGVGYNLFETSSFDPQEINRMMALLELQRQLRGDGVVMIDGGANIGVHALSAGRLMQGWGTVISFEAQERVFYALAGNVAMNNLFNVQVRWNALAQKCGTIKIPVPNYLQPSSFGSLEMQYDPTKSENIGQTIDLTTLQTVQSISIDSLKLDRLDFMKLDVEGMEEQVLQGAASTIKRTRPILHVERFKSDEAALTKLIKAFGYVTYDIGPDTLCIPAGDKILDFIK